MSVRVTYSYVKPSRVAQFEALNQMLYDKASLKPQFTATEYK